MTPAVATGAESLAALLAAQRPDGSWGRSERPEHRIVATIFAARSLQESGVPEGHAATGAALDFLARVAVVDGGGSVAGTRDSVLSCYTGMLALLFLGAGRPAQAEPLVEWIARHQPVAFGDRVYHRPASVWGSYLEHRYGGCMASTTCLLGLVPAVAALAAARGAGLLPDPAPQEAALRDPLVDRRVMFGRSGRIIPLSGTTKADPEGTRWLAPAFPLDHVVDLVALVQVARAVGVPWDAMPEAAGLIRSWELPGGGWPMPGRRRIEFAYRPEPVSRTARSEVTTRRVRALGLPGVTTPAPPASG